MKDSINKDVTQEDLKLTEESILKLENNLIDICKKIQSQEAEHKKFLKASHYVYSLINRAISLNRGFLTLTQVDNYSTAVSLIRLQVDTCLRLYALSLSDNWEEFYNTIMDGKHIRNIKDRDGNKMTDNYLVTKYDKIVPGFKELYQNTSGFVHFSDSHIKMNSKITDLNEYYYNLNIIVGGTDKINIYKKVDYAFNMFGVGKRILMLVRGYQEVTKKKFFS